MQNIIAGDFNITRNSDCKIWSARRNLNIHLLQNYGGGRFDFSIHILQHTWQIGLCNHVANNTNARSLLGWR